MEDTHHWLHGKLKCYNLESDQKTHKICIIHALFLIGQRSEPTYNYRCLNAEFFHIICNGQETNTP